MGRKIKSKKENFENHFEKDPKQLLISQSK